MPRSPREEATASITAAALGWRDVGHREAEMEPGRVAHGRIAAGNVGMDGVAGLDIGEGADDHPPDALHRIERQEAPVTLGERPHHRGLASGTEGGAQARLGGLLGGDQPVDDGAALHEQPVHRLVDAVDLLAQIGKVGRGLLGGHGRRSLGSGAFLWRFWPGLSSPIARPRSPGRHTYGGMASHLKARRAFGLILACLDRSREARDLDVLRRSSGAREGSSGREIRPDGKHPPPAHGFSILSLALQPIRDEPSEGATARLVAQPRVRRCRQGLGGAETGACPNRSVFLPPPLRTLTARGCDSPDLSEPYPVSTTDASGASLVKPDGNTHSQG